MYLTWLTHKWISLSPNSWMSQKTLLLALYLSNNFFKIKNQYASVISLGWQTKTISPGNKLMQNQGLMNVKHGLKSATHLNFQLSVYLYAVKNKWFQWIIDNFTVNFKSDIVVKLSPWFCSWIEFMFYVYLPFLLYQFVTREVSELVQLTVFTWCSNIILI